MNTIFYHFECKDGIFTLMKDFYKEFEDRIDKKYKFGWTPKYKETTTTPLKDRLFVEVALKAFEKLTWDVVYLDDHSIEAKRQNKWEKWTEKIIASTKNGVVTVKSSSLGSEIFDFGKNSQRVQLFIHVFKQTEKEFDSIALEKLEKQLEKSDNWDDYKRPISLPPPSKKISTPSSIIPIVGGILISTIIGFFKAYAVFKGKPLPIILDIIAAIGIAFSFKFFMKWGNYTDFSIFRYIIICSAIMYFISNQYSLYQLILNKGKFQPFTFTEFIKVRLEKGLIINDYNTQSVGLIISWILQMALVYFVVIFKTSLSVIKYIVERVPTEVSDFTYYLSVKEKSEEQIRYELAKMGWSEKHQQDAAFEAVSGIFESQELRRG